jgi:SAM-dependent methyltransferase
MKCILCNSEQIIPVLDMGDIPLANNLPNCDDPEDERFALDMVRCESCTLAQLGHVVPPEKMFSNYSYIPSVSGVLRQHFKQLQLEISKRVQPNRLVVDIGSNDGLLLGYFREAGQQVLGIDPAENLVPLAMARGVPTKVALFDHEVGKTLAHQADVVIATNCLAHTANLRSYLMGVAEMLTPEGVFVAEFPYLPNLLRGMQFDTIYHEHQSYFSLTPLYRILRDLGLYIEDAELVDVHGGSLRIWVYPHVSWLSDRAQQLLHDEQALPTLYEAFVEGCLRIKAELPAHIAALDGDVVGLAASAKATVLLNYCGIDSLRFVADANPMKQGKCIPGVRIPIVSEEHLSELPDYVLILAWNLMDDMHRKVAEYCPDAELIVPVP